MDSNRWIAPYPCVLSMIGIWLGLLMVMMASVIKEVCDYFVQKDNNREQVIHDVVCDIIGMVAAIIALLFW